MGAGIFVTIVLLFPLMVDRSAGWHNAANMDWCNIDFIKKKCSTYTGNMDSDEQTNGR
jgi:hypothetical protein